MLALCATGHRHLQVLLGLGLSAATWIIVTYPTEKTKERLSSDNVQPEMHLVLGTLLPELAVNMEKGLLWTDLLLRWGFNMFMNQTR